MVDRKIERNANIVEVRMLRWTSRVTREDGMRDEYVRGSIGVASIMDKMRENRLRWLWACDEARGNRSSNSGHGNVRKREKRKRETKKEGGWIRLRMIMKAVGVCIENVDNNRNKWRFRKKVVDRK